MKPFPIFFEQTFLNNLKDQIWIFWSRRGEKQTFNVILYFREFLQKYEILGYYVDITLGQKRNTCAFKITGLGSVKKCDGLIKYYPQCKLM